MTLSPGCASAVRVSVDRLRGEVPDGSATARTLFPDSWPTPSRRRETVVAAASTPLLGCVTVWFLKLAEPSVTGPRMVFVAAAAGAALILAAAYVGAAAAIRPVHDQILGLRSLHARGLDEL